MGEGGPWLCLWGRTMKVVESTDGLQGWPDGRQPCGLEGLRNSSPKLPPGRIDTHPGKRCLG